MKLKIEELIELYKQEIRDLEKKNRILQTISIFSISISSSLILSIITNAVILLLTKK